MTAVQLGWPYVQMDTVHTEVCGVPLAVCVYVDSGAQRLLMRD